MVITEGTIMQNMISFGEVVEAADRLSLDEQESLLDILYKRIIERRRAKLAQDIQDARIELQKGDYQPATPDEIMEKM